MQPLLLLVLLTFLQKDDQKAALDKFLSFYRENRELLVTLFSMQGMQPGPAQPEQQAPPKTPPEQEAQTKRAAQEAQTKRAAQEAPPDMRIFEEYLRRVSR